jgi:hypothetical protein
VRATAADYAWVDDDSTGLIEAYCVTLARGLEPAEFLARIGARPDVSRSGLRQLFEPSWGLWRERSGEELLISVAAVPGDGGDWALAVEINGFLGVREDLAIRLSAGTRLVSALWMEVNFANDFLWVEDGQVRLGFQPLFPAQRWGTTPDALLPDMTEAGFDLSDNDDEVRDDEVGDDRPIAATFALAERLTGVRVTPDLLENARYACGIVRAPA